MMRVITERSGDGYRLELHGMLRGDWVRLLEQHWRTILVAEPRTDVVVILTNVDFIDPAGARLLRRMADAGVELVVSGCMNRHLVEQLQPNDRTSKEGTSC